MINSRQGNIAAKFISQLREHRGVALWEEATRGRGKE